MAEQIAKFPVTFVDRDNKDLTMQVTKHWTVWKLLNKFCSLVGVSIADTSFIHNGQPIVKNSITDTVGELGLDAGDIIEVDYGVEQPVSKRAEEPTETTKDEKPSKKRKTWTIEDDSHLGPIKIRIFDGLTNYQVYEICAFKESQVVDIKESYATRFSVQYPTLRFVWNGQELRDHQRVGSLGIKTGDIISVYPLNYEVAFDGANNNEETEELTTINTTNPVVTEYIKIIFRSQDNHEQTVKILKDAPLKLAMINFADRIGRRKETLKFLFDGRRITDKDTPSNLEIEDGDLVEVFMHQDGGQSIDRGRLSLSSFQDNQKSLPRFPV